MYDEPTDDGEGRQWKCSNCYLIVTKQKYNKKKSKAQLSKQVKLQKHFNKLLKENND
jgi:Zn-finger protein